MFNKKDTGESERFKTVYDHKTLLSRKKIIVDTETGINYLINIEEGMAGGITVLLDKDGKPVVSQVKP